MTSKLNHLKHHFQCLFIVNDDVGVISLLRSYRNEKRETKQKTNKDMINA